MAILPKATKKRLNKKITKQAKVDKIAARKQARKQRVVRNEKKGWTIKDKDAVEKLNELNAHQALATATANPVQPEASKEPVNKTILRNLHELAQTSILEKQTQPKKNKDELSHVFNKVSSIELADAESKTPQEADIEM